MKFPSNQNKFLHKRLNNVCIIVWFHQKKKSKSAKEDAASHEPDLMGGQGAESAVTNGDQTNAAQPEAEPAPVSQAEATPTAAAPAVS